MDTEPQKLSLLSKLVILIAIVLIVAGTIMHGLTYETFARFWNDLVERPDGPMRFRFILQPVMAMIAAVRDGRKDARLGRTPFLQTVLRDPTRRVRRLNEALNATARIIVLGLVMDVIYQYLVLKTFYPNEALVVALLLALLPYLIIRGLAARFWRKRAPSRTAG
jgi:uncharacterized membrane protein YjgN (DUF898 family)